MRRVARLVGFMATVMLLSGCMIISKGNPPPDEPINQDSALIFGYVEAENDNIEQVDFVEFGKVYIPPFRKIPRVLIFDNGMFMAENVNPGKYVIAGFRSGRNHYNMTRSKRQSYQNVFRIESGEMKYLGSYNVRVTQKGKIDFGKFQVTAIQRPGERDVLKHLYKVTEGTAWQNRIARRLKELHQ